MDSGRLLYKGSGCAMVTPFTKENTVDCAALRKQAAFQLENGTDALIVCGTTGEASTMDAREQAEAATPERMRDAVRPDGVQPGVEQSDLDGAARGRIPKACGRDVLAHPPDHAHRRSQSSRRSSNSAVEM